MGTTQGRLYITALRSLERLEIQYVPKNVTMPRSASIGDISIIGRNTPKYHTTGGATTLNMELDFHAEEESKEDVIRKVRWLQSLTAIGNGGIPPEKIRVTFGDMFKAAEIWTVKAVNPRFELFDVAKGFLPRQAYVTLSLLLDPDDNITSEEMRWT